MSHTYLGPAYRIESERLVIRCYNPKDALHLKKSVQESVEHLRPWMPQVKDEPEELKVKIERLRMFRAKFDLSDLLTQILGYGMITAWWGTHYGMNIPFNPFDIIDLVGLWIIFIGFGILWYKIDRQEDLIRRILYYFNFFIVFVSILLLSFWMQGFWVPIPLMIISIYAIVALIIHYAIKKPLTTPILSVCTGFLVINFILMILQVGVSLPI